MDNETKISSSEINSIIDEAKNTDFKSADSASEFLNKHLKKEEAEKVKEFLSDKEKMKKLMESPICKSIMSGLMKNKPGDKDNGLE